MRTELDTMHDVVASPSAGGGVREGSWSSVDELELFAQLTTTTISANKGEEIDHGDQKENIPQGDDSWSDMDESLLCKNSDDLNVCAQKTSPFTAAAENGENQIATTKESGLQKVKRRSSILAGIQNFTPTNGKRSFDQMCNSSSKVDDECVVLLHSKSRISPPMVRLKRRRPQHLQIGVDAEDGGGGGGSGVEGFPTINDHKNHILICVTRALDADDESDALKLVGYRVNGGAMEEATNSAELTIVVRDFWRDSIFPVGSILRIIAPLRRSEKVCEVNAEHGLLISQPNTLLSCTTMAGMIFCARKTVFSDRLRGSCSSFAMLLGTIVHELFQKCVINKPRVLTRQYLFNEYRINHLAEVCVELVALGETTLSRFETELAVYLDSVSAWLKRNAPPPPSSTTVHSLASKGRKNTSPLAKGSSVCLGNVVDIEDNVWSPTLGVKGKIDVSFQSPNLRDTMPLELKTGKPHVMEHLSQVMLYSLMYSETLNAGRIAPGFLLYMKDNTTRQIAPKAAELKGVLQMRNRAVPYFSRLAIDGFPKPLENSRLCGYCEHSTTCALVDKLNNTKNCQTSATKASVSTNDTDYLFRCEAVCSEMRTFLDGKIAHLNADDFQYAEFWMRKIFEDWTRAKQKSAMDKIFFDSPENREFNGKCLADLKLESITKQESIVSADKNKYNIAFLMKFTKRNGQQLENPPFKVGEFVAISSKQQCCAFLNAISAIDEQSITISSDKMMFKSTAKDEVYCMDKYDSYSQFSTLLGNLAILMENSERTGKLRSLIIGAGRPPILGALSAESRAAFMAVKGRLTPTCKNQAVAVVNALKAEDYLLIDGEDEQDRVTTAALLVQCFLKRGRSILLTSFSWTSLDQLTIELLKYVNETQILRVGAPNYRQQDSPVTENEVALQKLCLSNKLSNFDERKTSEFFSQTRDVLMKTAIVMATCSRISTQSIFTARAFDVCLVLDAHKLSEPALVRPLVQVNSFILMGNLSSDSSSSSSEPSQQKSDSDDCVIVDGSQEESAKSYVSHYGDVDLMRRLAKRHPNAVVRLGKVEI